MPDLADVRENIAMGIGGFGEAMGALIAPLHDLWRIPKPHCDKVGATWEKYIERKTESNAPVPEWLARLLHALPLLGALGITGIVLGPRLYFTWTYLRSRGKQAPPDAPQIFEQSSDTTGGADTVAPPATETEGKTLGGGYRGETAAGEYASIDGTESQ